MDIEADLAEFLRNHKGTPEARPKVFQTFSAQHKLRDGARVEKGTRTQCLVLCTHSSFFFKNCYAGWE
jgi:hypothetical protein